MQKKIAWYKNPTDMVVKFEVGVRPGTPSEVVEVEPGCLYEGPEAYAKAFARQGLVLCDLDAEAKRAEKKAAVVVPKEPEVKKPEPQKATPPKKVEPKSKKFE